MYLEQFEKWWPDRLLHAKMFKRGLNIVRIKIPTPFERRKQMRKFWKSRLK